MGSEACIAGSESSRSRECCARGLGLAEAAPLDYAHSLQLLVSSPPRSFTMPLPPIARTHGTKKVTVIHLEGAEDEARFETEAMIQPAVGLL